MSIATFRFSVGSQYCIAKILLEGDSVSDLVSKFVSSENVPVYLEDPLHWASSTLLALAKDESNEQAEIELSLTRCLLGAENLSQLYLQYALEWQPPQHNEKNLFPQAYDWLVKTSDGWETIGQLEKAYSIAMVKLAEGRDIALESLRSRQFSEMEKLQKKAKPGIDQDLESLVQRHISEIESLESKWDQEIKTANKTQKTEFLEFVVSSYREEQQKKSSSVPAISISSAKIDPPNNIVSPRPKDELTPNPTPPLSPRSPAPSPSPLKNTTKPTSTSKQTPSKRISKAKRSIVSTFPIYLGSQLRIQYTVNLLDHNPNDFFKPVTTRQHSIYSGPLSACILLSDPKLSITSKVYVPVVSACNKSTDFHFPPFQEQIDTIKDQIAQSTPLDNGDFVATRHSNLQSLQIIFHLIQKGTDPDSIESLLIGLKNILTFASKHDVACITLPALLISESTHLFTDTQLLKHSEVVFRLIKSFLLHTIAQQTRISTIQLVLPPAKELAQKLKSNFANLKN